MATRTTRQRQPNYVAAAERIDEVVQAVAQAIEGKDEAIRLSIQTMLAGGHLLIEDVPGVGKTMLAKALARAISCTWNRIQFTPDLLPSDVTGVSVYDAKSGRFNFRPGAIFANLVLGDEINRASPKTQSALLEAMEERQVTVDGTTYAIDEPFMVIATQNPMEHEGIFPLPQSQIDRFTMRIHIGYPSTEAEIEILDTHGTAAGLDEVPAVIGAKEILALMDIARRVHVTEEIKQYIVQVCEATRSHSSIQLGASPRAALFLLRTARSRAVANGREYVVPDDVKSLILPLLAHRIVLTPEAELRRTTADQVLEEVWSRVPVPTGRRTTGRSIGS